MSPHGTEAGYKAHTRRGTPPCQACKTANTRARAERKRGRAPKPTPAQQVDLTAACARLRAHLDARDAR